MNTEGEQTQLGADGGSGLSLIDELYLILPEDGTFVPNQELREELGLNKSNKLRDQFWDAREELVDEGRAVKGRGRGGSTARAESVVEREPADQAETTREEALYDPLLAVLSADWQADKGIQYTAVEITARAGGRPTGGRWTRPDLVAVQIEVFTYLPSKVLSVHTFEVKPSDSIDVTAVYEALAHRRAATHSWVLLHVPNDSSATLDLEAVVSEARRHGIGVTVFSDPGNYETWDERVVAERHEPEPSALNEFIRAQLPPASCANIERAVR